MRLRCGTRWPLGSLAGGRTFDRSFFYRFAFSRWGWIAPSRSLWRLRASIGSPGQGLLFRETVLKGLLVLANGLSGRGVEVIELFATDAQPGSKLSTQTGPPAINLTSNPRHYFVTDHRRRGCSRAGPFFCRAAALIFRRDDALTPKSPEWKDKMSQP